MPDTPAPAALFELVHILHLMIQYFPWGVWVRIRYWRAQLWGIVSSVHCLLRVILWDASPSTASVANGTLKYTASSQTSQPCVESRSYQVLPKPGHNKGVQEFRVIWVGLVNCSLDISPLCTRTKILVGRESQLYRVILCPCWGMLCPHLTYTRIVRRRKFTVTGTHFWQNVKHSWRFPPNLLATSRHHFKDMDQEVLIPIKNSDPFLPPQIFRQRCLSRN